MDFSKELYNIMKIEDLTVAEVAKKTNVSESTLRSYLSKKSVPRIDVAYRIVSSLGYTIEIKGRR